MTRRSTVIPGAFVIAWTVAVLGALIGTLKSLRTGDFDGLNNLVQIPFALPWFLLPISALAGTSHQTDAWIDAGMGWMNGLLIGAWIRHRLAARR